MLLEQRIDQTYCQLAFGPALQCDHARDRVVCVEQYGFYPKKWDRSVADAYCRQHNIEFDALHKRVVGWKTNHKVPDHVVPLLSAARLAELA